MTGDGNPCLIVIEDNPADVQLLRFALDDLGLDCRLRVIHDGLEALRWVWSHRGTGNAQNPELAVIDLNLPKHDGIEILEGMQHTPELAGLPVLVLSSSASPRDVTRVEAFPNAKFMTKPIVLDDYAGVVQVIRELLDRRDRERPSRAS